jgi:hypothetical protein
MAPKPPPPTKNSAYYMLFMYSCYLCVARAKRRTRQAERGAPLWQDGEPRFGQHQEVHIRAPSLAYPPDKQGSTRRSRGHATKPSWPEPLERFEARHPQGLDVVAGAGFEPATFGL